MVTLDLLLDGFGSGVAALTVAVFVIEVPEDAVTLTVMKTHQRLETAETEQVTVPVLPTSGDLQEPSLEKADSKTVPAGSVSVMTADWAASLLLFVTHRM